MRWIGIGIGALLLVFGVAIPIFGNASTDDRLLFCAMLAVFGAISYGAGRALSWVVEGFAS